MNPLSPNYVLRVVDATLGVVMDGVWQSVPPNFSPGDVVWVSPDPAGLGWQFQAAEQERHTLSSSPKPLRSPLRIAGTASRHTHSGRTIRVGRRSHVLETILLRCFALAPARVLRRTLRHRKTAFVGEAA